MLRSHKEYIAAKKKLKQDDEALASQKEELKKLNLSKKEMSLVMSPLISFRNQIEEEIRTYEGIKKRDWRLISSLFDPHNIGRFLIALRIATGLTQRDFAYLLGVTEAQVSKDERNEYHGVSFNKAIRIMEIFHVKPSAPIIDKSVDRSNLLTGT